MPEVSFHELAKLDDAARAALLRRSETDLSSFTEKVVPIIEAVRNEGDAALLRFGRDLDRADLKEGGLKATEAEFERAFDLVDREVVEAIRFGIENIRHFHEEQKPEPCLLYTSDAADE